MARSEPRPPPEPDVQITKAMPIPAIASKPRSKPKLVDPAPPFEVRIEAKRSATRKPAAAPADESNAASNCNHSEPVPVLLQVIVGRNLRSARKAAGLTLRQVADMSGILFQYVYKIENGEKNLTLSTIANLAKVLHVNASDLLRDDPS
ncbi:MAG: helix-turn-helix domain-containing protein [Janthinobacterium lividum]